MEIAAKAAIAAWLFRSEDAEYLETAQFKGRVWESEKFQMIAVEVVNSLKNGGNWSRENYEILARAQLLAGRINDKIDGIEGEDKKQRVLVRFAWGMFSAALKKCLIEI